MLDLIIKGGRVVTSEGVGEMDVGVLGERIAALALPGALEVETHRTIDAGGKVLLPGGIERTPISGYQSLRHGLGARK